MQIRNKYTGEVIYECSDCATMKELVKKAVKEGVSLAEAELSGVDLYGANLTDASLAYADLRGANLSGASLTKPIN